MQYRVYEVLFVCLKSAQFSLEKPFLPVLSQLVWCTKSSRTPLNPPTATWSRLQRPEHLRPLLPARPAGVSSSQPWRLVSPAVPPLPPAVPVRTRWCHEPRGRPLAGRGPRRLSLAFLNQRFLISDRGLGELWLKVEPSQKKILS